MFFPIVMLLAAQPELAPQTLGMLLAPILVITALVVATTMVALFGDRERGQRARVILGDLLDLLRSGRGGRR